MEFDGISASKASKSDKLKLQRCGNPTLVGQYHQPGLAAFCSRTIGNLPTAKIHVIPDVLLKQLAVPKRLTTAFATKQK